jgi:class 3 adenylate cyclase
MENAMPLPAGTVTFLFTDIEDGGAEGVGPVPVTKLWEQHPQAMEAALARHDALAQALIPEHRGALVKHRGEGDSLFAVFARAADAVAAACALQQTLIECGMRSAECPTGTNPPLSALRIPHPALRTWNSGCAWRCTRGTPPCGRGITLGRP